jgi:hypothetical protein
MVTVAAGASATAETARSPGCRTIESSGLGRVRSSLYPDHDFFAGEVVGATATEPNLASTHLDLKLDGSLVDSQPFVDGTATVSFAIPTDGLHDVLFRVEPEGGAILNEFCLPAPDPDADSDGVLDAADAFPLDPTESVDTDGDGTGNNADLDDDQDGVADAADAFPLDPTESVDTDGDGTGNNADLDDDQDGVADAADAFPLDPTESVDTDGDGTGNNADLDDDQDGVADAADAFPLDPTESVDTDGDGTGNNADLDDDQDGVADAADAFPLNPNESVDTDGDNVGNNADLDDDEDGQSDADELGCGSDPLDSESTSPDLDGDSLPDCVDVDDDGDAVADIDDTCPGTVLPDVISELKVNRFAANADGAFLDAAGKASGYTIADTGGCSAAQIIAAAGLGSAHTRFGITRSALDAWVASVA